MNEAAIVTDPPVANVYDIPGNAFAGGFYVGRFRIGEQLFALIVSPKASGEHAPVAWNGSRKIVNNAMSFCDGLANTEAMAKAGSALAKWALGLDINGARDWYLPSRDELELLYRHLKPTDQENYVWRNGDNPSSVPPSYPYTVELPATTSCERFQGGPEAFAPEWYWSSTQSAGRAEYAWYQCFLYGTQGYTRRALKLSARAVRRVPIR